jgi:hypothetical protein
MRVDGNRISLAATTDHVHRLIADTTVSFHNNPAWRCARASCRAFFHACMAFNKMVPSAATANLRVLRKSL